MAIQQLAMLWPPCATLFESWALATRPRRLNKVTVVARWRGGPRWYPASVVCAKHGKAWGSRALDQIVPLSDDDLRSLIDETQVCRGALLAGQAVGIKKVMMTSGWLLGSGVS
jgi:hypothetical protein